jgi:hypothetical protein
MKFREKLALKILEKLLMLPKTKISDRAMNKLIKLLNENNELNLSLYRNLLNDKENDEDNEGDKQ